MRSHALKLGFSLNERNLTKKNGSLISEEEYTAKINKKIPTNEEDIFKFLDYKYVEPRDR